MGGVGCTVLFIWCPANLAVGVRYGCVNFVDHLRLPEVVAHAVLVSLVLHTELDTSGGSVGGRAQTIVPVAEFHVA